ncbi:MAG: hypothetical protein OSJ52_12445 [Lachnospiraceae bacterium]|nr:hypothetical protein [Lachnospiraceae bacterium]
MKKKEVIFQAISNLEERYLREAEEPMSEKGYKIRRTAGSRWIAAAVLGFCLLAGGIGAACYSSDKLPFRQWFRSENSPLDSFLIKAYASGSEEELTAAGAVMTTGSIRDSGEQVGHPLMFYLSGEQIESVRFSCEKQQLSFWDWTEKREEYGLARNFTIPYGEHTEDYYYLRIDWEPTGILEALEEGNTIATLQQELREDRIVMEIVFADKTTAVKIIQISLLDDGRFFAVFDDYVIQEEDTFVKRADDESIQKQSEKKLLQIQEQEKEEEEHADIDPEAKKVARAYYEGTVLEVVTMEVTSSSEEKIVFSVCVSKGGVLQEPNRTITLEWQNGSWEVTGEGY